MPISQLTRIDSLTLGDVLGIGSANFGDDRGAALSVLLTFLQNNLTISGSGAFADYATQYAAPSATGFSVQITDGPANTQMILTPVADYAAGTIILPAATNAIDKQEILINSTHAVTTLTIDGNGANVAGEPSSLAANDYFRLRYDLPGNTWYRVG
jgi:hypothetical protein